MENTKKSHWEKNEELLENIDKKLNGDIEDIKSINDEATNILLKLKIMLQYIDSLSGKVKDKFDYDDTEKKLITLLLENTNILLTSINYPNVLADFY